MVDYLQTYLNLNLVLSETLYLKYNHIQDMGQIEVLDVLITPGRP